MKEKGKDGLFGLVGTSGTVNFVFLPLVSGVQIN